MTITIGDKSRFAIECGITEAYERLSFRAWGYFVIFIDRERYGVFSPYATRLACSFDEVENRIADRGKHIAIISTHPDAGAIADAFRDVKYAPEEDHEKEFFFGMSYWKMSTVFGSNQVVWAPDGDAAFDEES